VRRPVNRRRLAGSVALTLTTGGALAAAACTPTVPTATLDGGTVTVTGTAVRDLVDVTMTANDLTVDFGSDGTIDARFARNGYQRVQVLAGEGDDGVIVSGAGVGDVPVTVTGGIGGDDLRVVANVGETGAGDAPITVNGDDGFDVVVASVPGPVTVQAGAGDDIVEGGGAGVGRETISLGAGNDLLVTSLNASVGVRNDVVDGGAGSDIMEVEGTAASEALSLSADGTAAGHLVIDHDRQDRIDADNIEDVRWFGLGGPEDGRGDTIVVNDLRATDVFEFTPDFSSGRGTDTPDNSSDTLIVRGTAGDDVFVVGTFPPNTISVGGLVVVSAQFLQPDDLLRIETLQGEDFVDSASLPSGLVQFVVL
jgi:hypothetical protein